MLNRHIATVALVFASLCFWNHAALAQADPLPSWNDGPTKHAITDFVARVTTEGHTDFVPADKRIATFDNDGTLWSEQPVYNQAAFAFDRIKAMAAEHPEWKDTAAVQGCHRGRSAGACRGRRKGPARNHRPRRMPA